MAFFQRRGGESEHKKAEAKLRLLKGNPERKSLVLCSPLALLLTERGLLHLYLYIGGTVDCCTKKRRYCGQKAHYYYFIKIYIFIFFSSYYIYIYFYFLSCLVSFFGLIAVGITAEEILKWMLSGKGGDCLKRGSSGADYRSGGSCLSI